MIAAEAYTHDDVENLWKLPYRVVPLLNQIGGDTRAIPLVEDISVPPDQLKDFLIRGPTSFPEAFADCFRLCSRCFRTDHFRPFLNQPSPLNADRIESLARELYEVAFSFGGTSSGEHGNGLSRTAFLRTEYGPLYRVFQKVKEVFDPEGVLNPEKIVSDNPH